MPRNTGIIVDAYVDLYIEYRQKGLDHDAAIERVEEDLASDLAYFRQQVNTALETEKDYVETDEEGE